jgi:hypothetical protein
MDTYIYRAMADEMRKIAAEIAHSISGARSYTPQAPGELKPPITPKSIKPKVADPATKTSTNTNYTRANVEAPGTNVAITQGQRSAQPPPVLV